MVSTHQQQLNSTTHPQQRQLTQHDNYDNAAMHMHVVPNTGQKPSPDIEWLKHSSGQKSSPLWTTKCSRTWVLPLWTTRRSRAKPSPLLCIMQWTPLVYIYIQHQHLCLNNYDTLSNWTSDSTPLDNTTYILVINSICIIPRYIPSFIIFTMQTMFNKSHKHIKMLCKMS